MTTAIIFDWDDTLFPTTYYIKKKINKQNKKYYMHKFKALENSIICLLKKSLQYKNVYIVTNATMTWFNMCVNKYCPGIIPYLGYVKGIMSARDIYSSILPDDVIAWKKMCIFDILGDNKDITQIVFASDLNNDFESAYQVKNIVPIRIKTFKFMEEPMICQIIRQQRDFTRFLDYIIKEKKLDNFNFYWKKIS